MLQKKSIATLTMLRLIYVVNHSYPLSSNGYAVRTHGVAAALARCGIEVIVISSQGASYGHIRDHGRNPVIETRIDGVRYLNLPSTPRQVALNGNHLDRSIDLFAEILKVFKPHVVMAASNWQNALPAAEAAHEAKLPFFYEVRGFWEMSQASWDPNYENSTEYRNVADRETQVAAKADHVFTINRLMREELSQRGVAESKVHVVPNGVNEVSQHQKNISLSREFLGIRSKYLVGYIGSFNVYEGLEDLISSVGRLRKQGMDVALLLVGSGENKGLADDLSNPCPKTSTYRKIEAEMAAGQFLYMPGRVPIDQVGAYYALLDLVVIPRKPFAVCELVSPIKPLEAIAHGKVVLMSDVAPLKDLAATSDNFHYFAKGNLDSLTEKLNELLSRENFSPTRCEVLERMKWENCVSTLLEKIKLCASDTTRKKPLQKISFQKSCASHSNSASKIAWQFPNRTEELAASRHDSVDGYLSAPWASMIETRSGKNTLANVHSRTASQADRSHQTLHTVCQHLYWQEAAIDWENLGITDAWLSHAAETGIRPNSSASSATLPRNHAWPLYAVNVEDPDRRVGLTMGKNPRSKRYLASFIGAHMPHYISESRLKLQMHAKNPSFYIKSTGQQWHYHGAVHEHQVQGKPLDRVYQVDDSVSEYNQVLSDSVFALCPAGAGRNTIRLWEAMAVGAIPVLVDEPPLFPKGGSLPEIDWNKIVLQFAAVDIPNLPMLLRRIPQQEILERQQRAMEAYRHVRVMRCFPHEETAAAGK
jgi:glycosyltransferase involved in cell wall biosynthesis